MNSREMYVRFVNELVDANINATSGQELELMKLARIVHRLDEQACNGYQDFNGNWDESSANPCREREERLLTRAREIAESLECVLYHQSDPRGWPLQLIPKAKLPKLQTTTENAQANHEYISANYPQIGVAVPPFEVTARAPHPQGCLLGPLKVKRDNEKT